LYVERFDRKTEWVLSSYKINGGDGVIPFAEGNLWQYECVCEDIGFIYSRENVFEVTAFCNGQATVAASCFVLNYGYADTFEGQALNARENYWTGNDVLVDVKPIINKALELAKTKREKRHAAIAKDVMYRILDTDPDINPNYTEKGIWNFFEYNIIDCKDGQVWIARDNRNFSFKWKCMGEVSLEGHKVFYNFLYDILGDAAGCIWSDEWIPGYETEREFDNTKTVLQVTGYEIVTVPAGTFGNCVRVTFERTGLENGLEYRGGTFHYIFAPSVGLIKMIHPLGENVEAVWELTKYDGTGEGYFPIGDGFFRRYEPSEIGEGFKASVEYTFDIDETGIVMFRNAYGTQERAAYEATLKKE